jgi:hypothetical protein
MKHRVAIPSLTHTHAREYTLEKRRQARRESKKSIRMFYLFITIANIIIITAISTLAYYW